MWEVKVADAAVRRAVPVIEAAARWAAARIARRFALAANGVQWAAGRVAGGACMAAMRWEGPWAPGKFHTGGVVASSFDPLPFRGEQVFAGEPAAFVTAAADVQSDRIELEIAARPPRISHLFLGEKLIIRLRRRPFLKLDAADRVMAILDGAP